MIAGMGTQIQSETCFSRHCSRDYSRNIGTGRWLSYQDGKVTENSQHKDSSSSRQCLIDIYSGHDKAKVKGRMLEHEVTFRHQVRELHRLYRRQRELMNQIQDDRQFKFQKKTDSSQSVIFPSYMSSQSAKRTWDGSHFLSSDFMLGRLDPSSSRAGQPPSTILKGKICESFNPSGDMYLRKPVHRSLGLVGNRVARDPLQERPYNSFFNDTVKYPVADSESNVLSKGRNYLNGTFQFLSSSSSVKSSCNLSRHPDKLEKQSLTDNVSSGFFLHGETSQNYMPAMNGRTSLNRSPSCFDRNGKELKNNGFEFSTDLSLHVEHKTESRKKRKIFGVEIAEEVDESCRIPNGAESNTLPCLSGKAFASHSSKKASTPQGNHVASTFELSWLKLGSCLQDLEFVGGVDARDDLKISVPKNELFHQSSLCVHPKLNRELIDGGVTESWDMWKGKDVLTSLPDLFEFQDSNNSWKSVNSNAPDERLSSYISGLRNHIDLNLTIDEAEIVRPEIDLEVPVLIESEAEHGGTKSEEHYQCPIKEAAEALVVISLTLTNDVASYDTSHLENTSDCLHLLADVISSYTSDGDGIVKENSQTTDDWVEEAIPDGMDHFEFMTLQLRNLKEETYCYSLSNVEHQNSEETEMSATKRRSGRGHGRRGRKQKDFKKDVLPDLVSLAKQEIVEDLHTLEELFHSTGKTWKSSLSAKKHGRGMKSGESLARLPSKQKKTGRELQLTGWGKRTRRRLPRQRCFKKSSSSIQLLSCA